MPYAERIGPLHTQTSPAGLVQLQSHLLHMFPTARAGGMYNPVSRLSGGGPSPHQVTSALDVMCDRATAARIIRYLITIANSLNLQQVIAWHEIVTVQRWGQGIRYYPENDHSDGNGHCHISVGLDASRNWHPGMVGGTPAPAPGAPPPPPPPPPRPIDPTEQDDEPVIYYQSDKHPHSFWIDANGDLQHHWGAASTDHPQGLGENLSRIVRSQGRSLGKLDRNQGVKAMVQPDTFGVIIQVDTFAENGWIVPFRFEGNPIHWDCVPYPPL